MRKRYQKIERRGQRDYLDNEPDKKSEITPKDSYADEQKYYRKPADDPKNNPYQYTPEYIEELKQQARIKSDERSSLLKNFFNVVVLVLLFGFLLAGKAEAIIQWSGGAFLALLFFSLTIVPIVFAIIKLSQHFSIKTTGRIAGFLITLLGLGLWVVMGMVLGG